MAARSEEKAAGGHPVDPRDAFPSAKGELAFLKLDSSPTCQPSRRKTPMISWPRSGSCMSCSTTPAS